MDQLAFASVTVRRSFDEFASWLLSTSGPKKSALSIHRNLLFFTEVEKFWGGIPSYYCLLRCFEAEGLRRFKLPMRWLKEVHGLIPDIGARERSSDLRRIQVMLTSLAVEANTANLVENYLGRLISKLVLAKTSIRSVRLALRPAVDLLALCRTMGSSLPNQIALDRYLLQAPGQAAALTGFVSFLNATEGMELCVRLDQRKLAQHRKGRMELELTRLLKEKSPGSKPELRWIAAALTYFHRVPSLSVKKIRGLRVSEESGGYNVVLNDLVYWIPAKN